MVRRGLQTGGGRELLRLWGNRMDKLRDPKWCAIVLGVLVVAGGITKSLLAPAEAEPAESKAARHVQEASPELGKYELAASSWNVRRAGEVASAPKAPVQNIDTARQERRWSGICVAIRRN
ncbi:MAG: hypothetical protein KDC95_10665 [Planctomycetes bacterium]|nr:hypothetical protein [Planctomycetota bacterium]